MTDPLLAALLDELARRDLDALLREVAGYDLDALLREVQAAGPESPH